MADRYDVISIGTASRQMLKERDYSRDPAVDCIAGEYRIGEDPDGGKNAGDYAYWLLQCSALHHPGEPPGLYSTFMLTSL